MKKILFFLLVLTVCVSLVATLSLSGCRTAPAETTPAETAPAETTPAETTPAEEGPQEMAYKEAPMLAKLVDDGMLPAVEERLPENPMVVEGPEGIGTYGGRINSYATTTVFFNVPGAEPFIGYEPIIGFEEDYSWAQPNIAEDYSFSDDGLTMTINLRKGIKWSDGDPFDADDIMYCFDYEVGNTDLFPVYPDWLLVDGEPITAQKIDQYTVQLNFPSPYPGLLNFLSHANGTQVTDLWFGFFQPSHYMSQYHPDFIEGGVEEADKIATEAGFASWAERYRAAIHQNVFGVMGFPDSPPTLNAYVCVERDTDHVLWQRNPYYWKVDTQGNQLPYIDEINLQFISELEAINASIISGDADWAQGNISDLALYAENRERGDYRILQWTNTITQGLVFNFTAKDPFLRELFNDIRFRQAVSMSLDRDEMISLYYLDLGIPAPYYASSISDYYEQEYYDKASEYVKYDPEAAKALLAELGLTETDSSGFLLRPDGRRLEIIFEYYEPRTDGVISASSELIIGYFRDIGINVIPRVVTFPQLQEDVVNNDVDMNFAHVVDGLEPLFTVHAHTAIPYNYSWIDSWAIPWAQWYTTGGAEGEEPPQEIKDLYDWWNVMKTDPSEENRLEAGRQIWRQMADQLYKVGTVGGLPVIYIAGNKVRNIPEDYLYNEWNYMRWGPLDPYFYIEGASADTVPNAILYEGPPGLGN
jgi:peptide/nickel transport system substrate-binding protein